ncbi:MAG: hypoxanthine phosphoribosyltransferase [Chitinophagaceae bacterium]|nr:MAG: hypoxanthine phosphoribosyltransferase [Chitinophagaceae bacterium]
MSNEKLSIQVKDKEFIPYLSEETILARVKNIAVQLSEDFKDKNPVFIAVLNGSFMFAADLMKQLHINSEITFVKLASYIGTQSSGKVLTLLGLDTNVKDRHVIIIEDIIDTGFTLKKFLPVIKANEPKSISICSLLIKPESLQVDIKADYIGFEIPNRFVVGYGLDYDGYGRNLKSIYQLK